VLNLVIASAEPSKVPFYIAGIVLVLWAVVLSAIGIRKAEFPDSDGQMKGVYAITAVLVVITIAMAIHTSAFIHS
jgi:hypothetical protein